MRVRVRVRVRVKVRVHILVAMITLSRGCFELRSHLPGYQKKEAQMHNSAGTCTCACACMAVCVERSMRCAPADGAVSGALPLGGHGHGVALGRVEEVDARVPRRAQLLRRLLVRVLVAPRHRAWLGLGLGFGLGFGSGSGSGSGLGRPVSGPQVLRPARQKAGSAP